MASPHLPSIEACYTEALVHTAGFSLHAVAKMLVSSDGKVVASDLFPDADDDLAACTRRVLDGILFPPHHSDEAVPVYLPLLFLFRPRPQVLGRCDLDHQTVDTNQDLLIRSAPVVPVHAVDAGAPVPTSPRGSLDKELIRRVIRKNINSIKSCYERQLVRKPSLVGRVSALFTIAGDGTVRTASTQSSTMHDPDVEDCINREICDWRFPEPAGKGYVIVSYPFNFTSGTND